jgi:hypothetical protein
MAFPDQRSGLQTENNHILIADLVIDGEKRHVATAPKNGFYAGCQDRKTYLSQPLGIGLGQFD